MSFINTALKISLLVAVGAILYKLLFSNNLPKGFVREPLNAYDFIVVGGGSAGCVVAARLSEHFSVLLVEAGNEFGWLSTIPMAAPFLQGTAEDWQYKTERQRKSSWGLINEVSPWPRGKGLGGSGQINYLVHYSGRQEDWEDMAAVGVQGWTSLTMGHYMAKLRGRPYRKEKIKVVHRPCSPDNWVQCSKEQCHLDKKAVLLEAHEFDAALQRPILYTSLSKKVQSEDARIIVTKTSPETSPLLKALIDASDEVRHLKLTIQPGESLVKAGVRWSSLKSHLKPATKNGKLHVLLNTRATAILIQDRKVTGVQLGENTVKVRHEVVVSAGAVETPKLLQISGLGPRSLLQHHGINVVADLPVGYNLHDHLNVPIYVSLEKPVSLSINKILRLKEVLNYAISKTGVFTKTGVVATVSAGDLGLLLFGMGSTEEKLFRTISNFKYETFSSVFPEHANHSAEGIVLLASCLKPRSRGSVQLHTKDPEDPPLIQPNYLDDPYDVNCTRQAIRLGRRLMLTAPFKRLGARMHLPHLEECADFEPSITDDHYVECLIRTIAITGYHPAGSVSMGNHSHSVLDNAFRVKQVSGLRVIDGSVLPLPLYGAPHSVLLAMAERAAQMIISEASPSKPQP